MGRQNTANQRRQQQTKEKEIPVLSLEIPLNRNMIMGNVKNSKVKLLIDTGATISCVALSFLQKLGISSDKIQIPENIFRITGVCNETHTVLGSIQLPISFPGLTVTHEFHVFKTLHTPMILGFDFLERHNATIDTGSKVVSINGGTTVVALLQSMGKDGLARAKYNTIIPPRTQSIIPVRISKIQSGSIALLEPVSSLQSKRNLMGAKCTVIANRVSNFLALNPTNSPIHLQAGCPVAIASIVQTDDITMFDEDPNATKPTIHDNIHTPHSEYVLSAKPDTRDHEYIKIAKELDIDLDNADLTEDQKHDILTLVGKNRDVFAKSISELGRTNLHYHRIETGDALPIKQRFYRHSPVARDEVDRQIKEMLENDIIEESTSPWHSPVVVVRKKNGQFRLAIDYRKINTLTPQMTFPLPRLDDVLDTIGEAKSQIFTSLDLASSFWQIPLDPATADRSSFITPKGIYQFKRVPYGLRNSATALSLVMSEVLRDLNWKICLLYVDDILILSKDFQTHLDHLSQVLERLRKANLTLKPEKCQFAKKSLTYLGHVITKDGVKVDPEKTKAVDTFPRPKNVKDVRSYLGMCNYYRRFVKNYAKIASPLNALLHKDTEFKWTEQCQKAFTTLKQALVTTPILAYPNMRDPFILSTDASGTAIGYILEQKDDNGRTRPVSYGGRALNKREAVFSVSELECLAVIEGIKAFHPYLANTHFDIYTDNIALKWLQNTKYKTGRLARWSLQLQGYSFTIHHRPGRTNKVADALSRREYPENKTETSGVNDEQLVFVANPSEIDNNDTKEYVQVTLEYNDQLPPNHEMNELPVGLAECVSKELPEIKHVVAEVEDLKSMQHNSADFGPMIKYLQEGDLPEDPKQVKRIIAEADNYVVLDGILYHLYYHRAKGLPKADRLVRQLAVPEPVRFDCLQSYHDSIAGGGHQGSERTYHALRNKYYWPNMYRDVYAHVQSCIACQKAKRHFHGQKAPLHPLPITDIFSTWHMDILGPIKQTPQNEKYILVVVDSFSKWCEAFPLKTQEASEIADILFREIFTRYGAPKTLISDRGRNFMSHLVSALCALFDVKRVHTSPYHPQTNAECERRNSVIAQSIRAYGKLDQSNWSKLLPGIMMALRATPATQSTTYSPYFLVFGREMSLPLDVALLPKKTLGKSAQHHLGELLHSLEVAREVASQNMEKAQKPYKSIYDRKVKEPNFAPGDKVWIFNPKVPVGLSRKLHNKWTGPYYITLKGPNHTYKLREVANNKEVIPLIHANRLKPYYSPDSRPVQPPAQWAQINTMPNNAEPR